MSISINHLKTPLMGATVALSLLGSAITQAHSQASYRPDSHAPAGVMAEHVHKQGEVMVGIRTEYSRYSDTFHGSDKVTPEQLRSAGYSMMATEMNMQMTMLDIMYAPTDRLTLMLMPMYMSMDMSMEATPMASGHGMMMSGMSDHMAHSGHNGHETSGLGDTNVSALYQLYKVDQQQLIGTLGVNMPTGDVDLKNGNGTFVHYGMQLGSGTWDLTPSLTYTGHQSKISWGAQLGAIWRMEDENDSGYALGDQYEAMAWSAYELLNWMSVSARLAWQHQDDIDGHYKGPHNHSSPADIQANYGGEFLDAGLGVNMVSSTGPLAGVRLGVEWVTRIDEDYNGYQLGLDDSVNVSLSYAF